MKFSPVFVIFFYIQIVRAKPIIDVKNGPVFKTVVTTKDITTEQDSKIERNNTFSGSYIDVQVVDKPHNLFIGRCMRGQKKLHGESIILNNDGKSHVSAVIKINVDGPIEITCVKVLDQLPGSGAYPSYISGGVGFQHVEIGVATRYGKGFNFYIQIFGYEDKKDNTI